MKTITRWLNEAKEQGYEWADAAIKNYDPEFSRDASAVNLADAICGAFYWIESPEGDEYWAKIASDSRKGGFSPDAQRATQD